MTKRAASIGGPVLAAFLIAAPHGLALAQSREAPPVAGRILAGPREGGFAPCAAGLVYRPVIDSAVGTGTALRAAELQVHGRAARRAHAAADAVLLVTGGWGEITATGDTARLGPGSVAHVPADIPYALASVGAPHAPLELLLVVRPHAERAALDDRAAFGCGAPEAAARGAGGRVLVVDPTRGERIAYCVFPLTITAQVDSNAAPGARLTAATGALRKGTEGAVHRGDDELVFVTHGAGRAFVGADTVTVGPGSVVFTPRGLRHGFIYEGVGTLEYFIVFSEPGPRVLFHQFAARPGPYCASGPPVP